MRCSLHVPQLFFIYLIGPNFVAQNFRRPKIFVGPKYSSTQIFVTWKFSQLGPTNILGRQSLDQSLISLKAPVIALWVLTNFHLLSWKIRLTLFFSYISHIILKNLEKSHIYCGETGWPRGIGEGGVENKGWPGEEAVGGYSWETMFDPRKECRYKRVMLVRNLVPSITNLYILVPLLIIAWSYRYIKQINWWSRTLFSGGGGHLFSPFLVRKSLKITFWTHARVKVIWIQVCYSFVIPSVRSSVRSSVRPFGTSIRSLFFLIFVWS